MHYKPDFTPLFTPNDFKNLTMYYEVTMRFFTMRSKNLTYEVFTMGFVFIMRHMVKWVQVPPTTAMPRWQA